MSPYVVANEVAVLQVMIAMLVFQATHPQSENRRAEGDL